ncbi:MAG: hypothetical protein ACFB0B_15480 [Thermonemataceae bacterium]
MNQLTEEQKQDLFIKASGVLLTLMIAIQHTNYFNLHNRQVETDMTKIAKSKEIELFEEHAGEYKGLQREVMTKAAFYFRSAYARMQRMYNYREN